MKPICVTSYRSGGSDSDNSRQVPLSASSREVIKTEVTVKTPDGAKKIASLQIHQSFTVDHNYYLFVEVAETGERKRFIFNTDGKLIAGPGEQVPT